MRLTIPEKAAVRSQAEIGVSEVWDLVLEHRLEQQANGYFAAVPTLSRWQTPALLVHSPRDPLAASTNSPAGLLPSPPPPSAPLERAGHQLKGLDPSSVASDFESMLK